MKNRCFLECLETRFSRICLAFGMWHAYKEGVQFFFVGIIIDKYNDKLYILLEKVADVCSTPYLLFFLSFVTDLTEDV